ncbi:MAG: hypothetical protein KME25_30875 [Symplocastrum torsivum CPER-KK1]|uniref:Uncharacterized protein n=1 Tax=Symplocastrum torsivum CPER-KK1 TaxID=450513 RepID=A0A951UEH0_9CYAN|nr:hypothetical protein [Symplocastrum torsivum CPER-KK1]
MVDSVIRAVEPRCKECDHLGSILDRQTHGVCRGSRVSKPWDRVERIVSDWCDAYGGLRQRKQWLAENQASL